MSFYYKPKGWLTQLFGHVPKEHMGVGLQLISPLPVKSLYLHSLIMNNLRCVKCSLLVVLVEKRCRAPLFSLQIESLSPERREPKSSTLDPDAWGSLNRSFYV